MSNVLAHVGSGGSGGATANIYVTGLTDISEKLVPDGYTQLEYIQSSGAQYIDTGFASTTGFTVDTTIIPTYYSSSQTEAIIGAYTASSPYYRSLLDYHYSGGENTVLGGLGNSAYGTGTATITLNADNTFHFSNENNSYELNVNDNSISLSITGTQGTKTTSNLFLFAINTTSGVTDYAFCKMRYLTLYVGGNTVRNFIPCKNSSGTVGMYDTIGKTFYSSATSTAFTAGPEIVYTTSCTMTTPSGKVKEAIWEKIPIPTETAIEPMTSYTEPEGTMSYSAEYADGAYSGRGYIWGHAAGDGVRWLTYSSQLPAYTEYDIGESKYISKMVIYQSSTSNVQVGTAYVSVDGVKVADVSITTGGATEVDIGVTGQVVRLTVTVKTSTYGSEGAMLHGIMLYVYDPVETDGYICYATEYGTHTVTAINNSGVSRTKEILVDCLADYYISIDYYTLALLHFDDSVTEDELGNTWTNNNCTISTDQYKWGSALYQSNKTYTLDLYGNGELLTFLDHDWTIDFWCYTSSSSNSYARLLRMTTANGAWWINNYSGGMYFETKTLSFSYSGQASYNRNTWAHYAFVYDAGTKQMLFFVNGALCSTGTFSTAFGNLTSIVFGNDTTVSDGGLVGYYDELRISSCKRWTEAFTVPDEPYTI